VGDGSLRKPAHWMYLRNPFRPSWGEPYVEIAVRMRAAMADAARAAHGHEAVCVSHQLPIWTVRMHLEGRRYAHDPRRRECGLASVTSVTFDGDRFVGTSYAEPAGATDPETVTASPASLERLDALASRENLTEWFALAQQMRSVGTTSMQATPALWQVLLAAGARQRGAAQVIAEVEVRVVDPHGAREPERDEADYLAVSGDQLELAAHHRSDLVEVRRRSLEDAHPTDVHRAGVVLHVQERRVLGAHPVHLRSSLLGFTARGRAQSIAVIVGRPSSSLPLSSQLASLT